MLPPTASVKTSGSHITHPNLGSALSDCPVKPPPSPCHPHTFCNKQSPGLQTKPSFRPKAGMFSQEAIHPVCRMRQQPLGEHLFLNPWCAPSLPPPWRGRHGELCCSHPPNWAHHGSTKSNKPRKIHPTGSLLPRDNTPRISLLPPPQFCSKSRLNPIFRLEKSGNFEWVFSWN